MPTAVVMPKLGLTMEQGTVGAWLIQEGQKVAKGQPLFEVITDKVDMEIEAPASGVLRKILVEKDEEVPVAHPIGVIAEPDEDVDAFLEEIQSPKEQQVAPPEREEAPTRASEKRPRRRDRIVASPAAKKMAREAGIDLSLLTGTGPSGRITSEDVEAFLESGPPGEEQPLTEQVIPRTRVQKITAERLTESVRSIPHIHLTVDVNVQNLVEIRGKFQNISYNDIVVKATATALREFPRLNAVLEGEHVRLLPEIHIGVAVATEAGLLVPVIKNADRRTLSDIARESARLIDLARKGNMDLDHLTGGTFTVTNLGMYGGRTFIPIINPPQMAILAVGAIENRVVPLDQNSIGIRAMMSLNLGCDHRVVDGALGAQFLNRLKEVLENLRPESK